MGVLVLGVGNVLLQDEGVGVRVVEELQRRFFLRSEVTVMDGGTAGMALLDDLLSLEHLIIVDAVNAEQPPGTMIRLSGDEVPAFFQATITPHQLGIAELLATLRLIESGPRNIVLLGIVPESTELSLELSAELSQRLSLFVAAVLAELETLGVPLVARENVA